MILERTGDQVEVFRDGEWLGSSFANIQPGQRFRMSAAGMPVKDEHGNSEWVATSASMDDVAIDCEPFKPQE